MQFRHIINGCSVNLRTLTDSELKGLLKNNELRAALMANEHDLLIAEMIRRSDIPRWRQLPDPHDLL